MESAPGEVTLLLFEVKMGHRDAEERLIPLVYNELKRIARMKLRHESPDISLQPTSLVHEAYLRLTHMDKIDWQSRSHFYGIAARQMRNVLVDHAKERNALKRGRGQGIEGLDPAMFPALQRGREVIALDDALNRLAELFPRASRVVELRFFGGLTEDEIALIIEKDVRTVKRDWAFAKAWLFEELSVNTRKLDPKTFLNIPPGHSGFQSPS
jgi:RNA polymerase sigma factor (TIGR02999 family)